MTDRDLDWWLDWRTYVGGIIAGIIIYFLDKVLPG